MSAPDRDTVRAAILEGWIGSMSSNQFDRMTDAVTAALSGDSTPTECEPW